jgi:hypothetical protein
MKQTIVLDLSKLPAHGLGTASPTWWGTLAFMLVEGTGFALAIVVYLYLMSLAPQWPLHAPAPDLFPGTVLTLLLIASLVPNVLVARWARAQDLRKVRIGLIVMSLMGIAPMIVRVIRVSGDAHQLGPERLWLDRLGDAWASYDTHPDRPDRHAGFDRLLCIPGMATIRAATAISVTTPCTGTSWSRHGCRCMSASIGCRAYDRTLDKL